MPTLPVEVWFHIAEFIPPYDLPRLVGVNRLFFEVIMDQLYNQLSFISSDSRVFTEKVKALRRVLISNNHRYRSLIVCSIISAARA